MNLHRRELLGSLAFLLIGADKVARIVDPHERQGRQTMKTSILMLALGIPLASAVPAYASESPNPVKALEDLFLGSDRSHRAYHQTVDPPSADPEIRIPTYPRPT